jgi:tRNA A-37 threonylcarbamoyl transferase component Bud32
MNIIKELKGYSGSKIYLVKKDNQYFVRKIGNVKRNYDKLSILEKLNFPVVKILNYENDILDLEFIPGLDIKNYLIQYSPKSLSTFIIGILNNLQNNSNNTKDYSNIIENKINEVDISYAKIILEKVPKLYSQSEYLGDFTLENILFNKTKGFIIIDQSTVEYDSWYFDLAKLNQDLTCKWFLRYCKTNLDSKIVMVKNDIENYFGPINNFTTALMLLRVYKHAKNDNLTKEFLKKSIENLLWK